MSFSGSIIKWLKIFLVFAVIIAGLWLIWHNTDLFMPFLVALIVAYFLNPVVDFFEGRGINRTWSVILLYVVFGTIAFVFAYSFLPTVKDQAVSLKQNLPEYMKRLQQMVLNLIVSAKQKVPGLPIDNITDKLNKDVISFGPDLAKQVPDFISTSLTFLGMMIMVPFILFFYLKDGRSIKKSIISLVPNRYFEMVLTLLFKVNQQISGYITGRLVETIWIFALTAIGFYFIGLKYIIFMALIAGVMNIIPYVGPVLGAVPAVIVAMIAPDPSAMIIGIAIVVLIVQLLDNVLIGPVVVGKSVSMHPLVVILALLMGAKLMGIIGLILAIPLLGSLIVTFKVLYRHLIVYQV